MQSVNQSTAKLHSQQFKCAEEILITFKSRECFRDIFFDCMHRKGNGVERRSRLISAILSQAERARAPGPFVRTPLTPHSLISLLIIQMVNRHSDSVYYKILSALSLYLLFG